MSAGIERFTAELNRRQRQTQQVTLRFGSVTSVTAPTITVSVAGASIENVNYLDSYSPSVGDTVAILRSGSTMLVVGSIAS